LRFEIHYPYPYYYPKYRLGIFETICVPGHWERDSRGYYFWITGFCNKLFHRRHDRCFYYYDYCR
jgi:hypothetical protein